MNDIEAGKAHITTYVENSQFFKGLKAAESSFKGFGDKLMAIGSRMTGIGDAVGLTIGREASHKLLKFMAGATLGAAIAAPIGIALKKLFDSGAANGLLLEVVRLGSSISDIVETLATAMLPMLQATTRIVAGIVGGVNRWVGNNKALITTFANVITTVATIGAGIAAIGAAASFIGTGFGFIATAVSAVATFLATPLGITVAIAAAVAAAAYAWVRFTASGKAAAQFLLDVFKPTLDVIGEALGGIGDALMAGNLQLAGQIAITALQLLFQQGIDSIAELIGGTLGAALGDIGTRLISGDLKGAWDSAVSGMAAMWAAFSSGVVEVFAAAASAVLNTWKATVTAISNFLLDASAKGGIMGKVASKILGVDMSQEQAKAEQNRLAQIDVKKRLLAQAEKDAQTADKEGTHRGLTGDNYRKFAADLQQQIAQLEGTKTDVAGEAKDIAAGQIAGQAAAGQSMVEALRKQAEENAKEAIGGHQGRLEGAPSGSDRERELQNRLDGLRKQAAKERAGVKDPQFPDKQDFGKVAVGFSGAALALQLNGGGQNIQKDMLGELKKNRDLMAQAVALGKKFVDKAAAFGITE